MVVTLRLHGVSTQPHHYTHDTVLVPSVASPLPTRGTEFRSPGLPRLTEPSQLFPVTHVYTAPEGSSAMRDTRYQTNEGTSRASHH